MPEGIQAGGSIKPKRIIRLTTAGDNKVVQASAATAPMFGISGQGTRYAEITGLSLNDGYHAKDGENCRVFGVGDVAPLIAGSGGTTVGATITSDGDGAGIVTTTDGHYYIGHAMQAVDEGEAFECRVLPGQRAS